MNALSAVEPVADIPDSGRATPERHTYSDVSISTRSARLKAFHEIRRLRNELVGMDLDWEKEYHDAMQAKYGRGLL